jgi:hypothetical protein
VRALFFQNLYNIQTGEFSWQWILKLVTMLA